MTSRPPLLAAAIALALAGCTPDSTEKAADTATDAPAEAPAAPRVRQTLAEGDVESAALTGELACAFTERGATSPLLVAQADVIDEARAQGVLRLGPSTLRLSADKPGGFNAMVHGARFISGDLEARVIVTSNVPTGGGESPPLPARLEITSDAGIEQIAGEWTCGP
jgi:hypothetical protein